MTALFKGMCPVLGVVDSGIVHFSSCQDEKKATILTGKSFPQAFRVVLSQKCPFKICLLGKKKGMMVNVSSLLGQDLKSPRRQISCHVCKGVSRPG